MSLEALIFDVDGTLADTEEAHRVAFNNAFERCRLDWRWSPDEYKDLLKTTGGKGAHRGLHRRQDGQQRRAQTAHRADPGHPCREDQVLQRLRGRRRAAAARGRGAADRRGAGGRLPARHRQHHHRGQHRCAARLGAGLARHRALQRDRLRRPGGGQEAGARHLPARAAATSASTRAGGGAGRFAQRPAFSATRAGLWTVVTPTYWTEHHDFAEAGLVLPSLAAR